MPTYRKKPVEIEAWLASDLISYSKDNWSSMPEPIEKAYNEARIVFFVNKIEIVTLEGVMTANAEDYVIKGLHDELYPCKPEIFADTYDTV